MKTIAIFNNKGGVGKTTFCANIATHFATTHNKRVLVVDLDPQANITHYMLGDEKASEVIAPYYDRQLVRTSSTIIDAFDKYELGESSINIKINPIYCERFKTSLIPGNPFLAAYEDILSKKWNELSDPDNGSGIRISNWVYTLLQAHKENYDYAFLDLSPSLGALNRTALLAADYFAAPMSCDIFSLVAIKNIRQWFEKWIAFYDSRCTQFRIDKSHIWDQIAAVTKEKATIHNGFLGYTLQSYISRKDGDGKVRTTQSYQKIIDNFDPEISNNLGTFKAPTISDNAKLNLGEIPHMFGILALSQFVGAPISELNANDGMAGSQYVQAKNYRQAFDAISVRLMENLGEPTDVA
jgi:cellulose biosynthesis protein BcsQ